MTYFDPTPLPLGQTILQVETGQYYRRVDPHTNPSLLEPCTPPSDGPSVLTRETITTV